VSVNGRKWHQIADLFTTDEINRAMILFLECKKTKEDFTLRCYNEVVQPVISRVNAYIGYSRVLGLSLGDVSKAEGITVFNTCRKPCAVSRPRRQPGRVLWA
jgi:hypothetical protein